MFQGDRLSVHLGKVGRTLTMYTKRVDVFGVDEKLFIVKSSLECGVFPNVAADAMPLTNERGCIGVFAFVEKHFPDLDSAPAWWLLPSVA